MKNDLYFSGVSGMLCNEAIVVQCPKKYLFNLRGSALRSAQVWAVILPAYILFGWNNAVAGPLLNLPSWVETFPRIDTVHTTGPTRTDNSRVQGTVVATYTLGAFIGALSCICTGDRLGRIRTMQLGALIDVVGTVLQATSFSLPQLIIGRLITGFGLGAVSATAPNWQSECSRSDHRGATVVLESVFISAGLALSGWVNLGMRFVAGSASWRFPLALSALWALLVVLASSAFPESPRWLILKGKTEEAREVLASLEGLSVDHPQVQADLSEISESLVKDGQCRFIDIFKNGELRLLNRVVLACAGQMFQQMSGINALGFYQSTIFEQYLGLSATTARILSACVFTFQTCCSPIGVLAVDRFGRRKLMMASAFGMGTCMTIIAATTSQSHSVVCVGVACAFIFLFSLFFPVGFLGLTFLYASEISPLMARVPITAMSTGSAWIFNFLIAEITPIAFATIGWRYYIVFASTNFFLILPCVYLFFPETNGLHLEEVDQIFRDSKHSLETVKMAARMPRNALAVDVRGASKSSLELVEFTERNDMMSDCSGRA